MHVADGEKGLGGCMVLGVCGDSEVFMVRTGVGSCGSGGGNSSRNSSRQ